MEHTDATPAARFVAPASAFSAMQSAAAVYNRIATPSKSAELSDLDFTLFLSFFSVGHKGFTPMITSDRWRPMIMFRMLRRFMCLAVTSSSEFRILRRV